MQPLIEAFVTLFTGVHFWLMIGGALLGLLVGALPGLGGGMAIALLLPLTYSMDPGMAVVLLITAYGANPLGGSIPAILINTPGSGENASTTLDGYPLAKQGKAGIAIGAVMMSSALGTIIGFIALIFLIPFSREIVLAFSYPEFFMMALFGLTVIVMVTKGNRGKGMIAAGFGLLFSFVGREPVNGSSRFTFHNIHLEDGLAVVAVVIGLMALGEAISLYAKNETVSKNDENMKVDGILKGFWEAFRHWGVTLRSSIIGIIIGAVPGVGGQVAGFLAYGQAAQFSKHPERFGKGAVEGVIASEASHNAKEAGSFLPTLAFGIPGSSAMAILLGGLILHGISPGPEMMLRNLDVVYLLMVAWMVGGIVTAIAGSIAGKYLVFITKVPSQYIAPAIIFLTIIGVYSLKQSMVDVFVLVFFGMLGFQMKKYGFPRVAMVIGFVLGSLTEISFQQTVSGMGYLGFFTRPFSLILLILTLVAFFYPSWQSRRQAKKLQKPWQDENVS
ncbi:tripartite tricarboxylate transporter permease [Ammoniphilus sp. YIM 78166]|uniref:tripartite tricarboxylate transporter permease n=1 Tax=Ammoniphilus sp. YIM 78166 TaxID=1644106 RepID=UPI00106F681F|nr:tripartite tricarboxylate transporter permease [Ammoniphilus sp. YIM 78166]